VQRRHTRRAGDEPGHSYSWQLSIYNLDVKLPTRTSDFHVSKTTLGEAFLSRLLSTVEAAGGEVEFVERTRSSVGVEAPYGQQVAAAMEEADFGTLVRTTRRGKKI
jgi:hypothetical protein